MPPCIPKFMQKVKTSDGSISVTMNIGEEKILIDVTEDGIIFHGCSIAWCFANNTMSDISFGDTDISLTYNGFNRIIGVHGEIDAKESMVHPKEGYVGLILKR